MYRKNTDISNVMKICIVRAELFHVDGSIDRQTVMMKLIFAFCSFVTPTSETQITCPVQVLCIIHYK